MRLAAPIVDGRADVVFGVRRTAPDHRQALSFRAGNRALSLMTSVLFGARVSDMESCFKVLRTDVFRQLDLRANRFEIRARDCRARAQARSPPARAPGRVLSSCVFGRKEDRVARRRPGRADPPSRARPTVSAPGAPDERGELRATALVVLALALTIATLHSKTLFGGRVYHADDVGAGYWPSHVAILRALAAGELPVWEPRAWGGYPLVAVPYYGTFYPPNALFWLLGTTRAVAWLVAAHQLAGGMAMLSLLRRRGRALPAASFGAFAYALGTFSVERIRHLPFQQMVAWIPLLLLGIGEIVDTRARRGVPLVALALGAMCLAGAEPLLPFVLALALAYSLPRALGAGSLRVWGGLVAGPLLGAGIGAAQLVPTLWHLPLSPRALGTSYEFASSYAWPDLRWLVTLVAPDLFGVPHAGRWFGPYNHWELAGYYVGALAVALAFAAPVARKRELAALAVLSLAAIGIALGDAGPIHPILFRYAPAYASLRCPARALVILTVTVPILAAEGVDRLGGLAPSDRALGGWFVALVLCTLALLVAGGLSPHGGPAEAQRAATHHLILQIVAFCACGALLAAGMAHHKVAWAATALLALDLSTIGRGYLEPVDAQSVTALSREPAVQRMLAVVGDDRAAFGRDLGVGAQNLGLVDDFREVAGYDSFPVWRWVHLLSMRPRAILIRTASFGRTWRRSSRGSGHPSSTSSTFAGSCRPRSQARPGFSGPSATSRVATRFASSRIRRRCLRRF